jgi:type I restriction enzyme, S subunit
VSSWAREPDEEKELPEGWAVSSLGDLLEPGGLFDGPFGSSLKTLDYTESGVRVIRLENIANLRFLEDKHTFISPAKYMTLIKHTVREGDIVVGSFVDGAVRVCVLPALQTKAIAKADCFCVRVCAELVDRRFIALQLGTDRTRDKLSLEIHGATRPRVTTRQLRALEMLVAPLAEQRRIVTRVDELFRELDTVRHCLARASALLRADTVDGKLGAASVRTDKLTQSILAKAFRGELVPTEAELARREGRDYETASALLERIRAAKPAAAATARRRTPRAARHNR